MVLNNIEQLLEKYENGETSLKEEQQLKDYFSQETVAPHLEVYKSMFGYFLVNQQEHFTKQLPLLTVKKTKKSFNYKWLSVAAVAVLMVSIFFLNPFDKGGSEIADFNPTPAELQDIENAKAALALVSKHYNKAVSQVSYIDVIDKAGTQIDYLKEMNNPMDRIFKGKY